MTVGWIVGVEPRIQVMKARSEDLKELIQVQLASIDKRLSRIEESLNGTLRKD
jgi:hypothetical protein